MKFDELYGRMSGHQRGLDRRKPLRTCGELAEELGTAAAPLSRLMRNDPNGPRPVINNRRKNVAQRAIWYDPEEVRRWWRARSEARPVPIPHESA